MKFPVLFSAPILAAMQPSPKKRRRNDEDRDTPHTSAFMTATPQRPAKRTKKAPTPFEITTHNYEEPPKVIKDDNDSGNSDDTFSVEEREEYATLLRSTVCLPSNSNVEREWDWYYNLRQRLDKNALPDVLRGRLGDLRKNDDRLANLDIAIARVKAEEKRRREEEREDKARAEKEIAERPELERKERERVAEEKAAEERRVKELLENTLAGIRRETEEKERREQQEALMTVVTSPQETMEEHRVTHVDEQPVEDEPCVIEGPTLLERDDPKDLRVDSVIGSHPPLPKEPEKKDPEKEEEVKHETQAAQAAQAAEEVRLSQERRAQLLAGIPASSIPGLPSKQFMLDHIAELWPTLRDGLNAMTPKDLKREADMEVLDKLFIDPGEMCFLCLTTMASDKEIVGTGWNVRDLSQLARCLYCAPKEEPYMRMMESLQRIKGIIGDANSRLMTTRIEARAKAAACGKASQPRNARR